MERNLWAKNFRRFLSYFPRISDNVDPFVARISQNPNKKLSVECELSAGKFRICSSKNPLSSLCCNMGVCSICGLA